ncbi:hypothetical protein LINPERPRIM_LOCUS32823 [Linum perenne]
MAANHIHMNYKQMSLPTDWVVGSKKLLSGLIPQPISILTKSFGTKIKLCKFIAFHRNRFRA